MKNKRVAIILLNWNNSNDTLECVESISNNREKSFRIIIMDNGSSATEIEILQKLVAKYSHIDIKIVLFKENLGFSLAHNKIFNSYLNNEEYIWILNNDTVIPRNSLSELLAFLDQNVNIDVAGSIMTYYTSSNTIQAYGGGKYYPILGLTKLLYKNYTVEKLLSLQKINPPDYLMGSSLLIRKNALNMLKGFDDSFFVYGEDLDLSLRARKKGLVLGVCPQSCVLHKDSGSTKEKKDIFYYLLYKSNIINTKKHYPYYLITAIMANIFYLLLTTNNFNNIKSGLNGIINGIWEKTK